MKRNVVIESNFKDIMGFAKMIPVRKGKFEEASAAPLPKTYAVNETAAVLHPPKQVLTIKRVTEHTPDVKSYVFARADGAALAPFLPGQYVCVVLQIGAALVSRPYSLSSSPKQAAQGEYEITVKRVDNGFVSGHILDHWQPGDAVTITAPEGHFTYEPLRDAESVVGAAGGSGITPFLSMARAIDEGSLAMNLILLYGCNTEKEILFRSELDDIAARSEHVRVVYVLSGEKKAGCERGFISADLIRKYAPERCSLFACGPEAMYEYLRTQVESLQMERKYVRFEVFGEAKHIAALPEFPAGQEGKCYTCTVICRGEETAIPCCSEESLLTALERAGIALPSRCRSGECGFCRSKLLQGEVFIPRDTDHRRIADARYRYIHPCCTYPLGDISLRVDTK